MLFEYSEVALENINRACKVHYRENLTTCDILAFEQGPPILGWIKFQASTKSFMFIYVESGKSIFSETLELDPFQSQPLHKKMRKSVILYSVISPIRTAKSIASSVILKSLSAVDMLKLGKIIEPVETKILNVGV